MKKLSLIIPVYNTEKYLSECLDSVLVSEKNLEILLIDDGSTDESPMICDEYSRKDNRIKVIHKKNGGVSSARNLGIKECTGDYIMFVDSDDVLDNNWDIIIDYVNDDDYYIFDKRFSKNISKEDLIKYITGYNDLNICIAGPIKKIIKKDMLIKWNIKFNDGLINGEDMLFNLEVLLKSNSYSIVPCYYFYYYRQSYGQSTRKFNEKIINSDKLFHKLLEQLFNEHKIATNIKKEIEDYCKINAITVILNRISYIDSYKNAEKYFQFINESPYKNVIENNLLLLSSKQIKLFNLLRKKDYKKIYYILKMKNKILLLLKKIQKKELVKI